MATDRKTLKARAVADVAIVEEILRRWDPIGVMPGQAGPEDEYNSYAPQLLGMLQHGSPEADVRAQLSKIRTQDMGLPERAGADSQTATELVGWWRSRSQR